MEQKDLLRVYQPTFSNNSRLEKSLPVYGMLYITGYLHEGRSYSREGSSYLHKGSSYLHKGRSYLHEGRNYLPEDRS